MGAVFADFLHLNFPKSQMVGKLLAILARSTLLRSAKHSERPASGLGGTGKQHCLGKKLKCAPGKTHLSRKKRSKKAPQKKKKLEKSTSIEKKIGKWHLYRKKIWKNAPLKKKNFEKGTSIEKKIGKRHLYRKKIWKNAPL